MQNAPIKFTV